MIKTNQSFLSMMPELKRKTTVDVREEILVHKKDGPKYYLQKN